MRGPGLEKQASQPLRPCPAMTPLTAGRVGATLFATIPEFPLPSGDD